MELPVYTCLKTTDPICIDGILDEPVWAKAEPAVLSLWNAQAPASQETVARLCWDNEYLYLAFQCADSDIYGTFTRQGDPVWTEEAAEMFICPSGDLINYFEFQISPRNIVFDIRMTNPHHSRTGLIMDPHWDCPGLRTAVHVVGTVNKSDDIDKGWSVEMAIPFASLKGAPNTPPLNGDKWRFNLFRIDMYPQQEYLSWSAVPGEAPDFHQPGRFGVLQFEG